MDLTELAARWGIEPSYFDVQGHRRDADEDTIRRIVEALSAGGNQPAFAHEHTRTPERAYQGDGRKCWVLAVQLYSVRSRRNWGHGDFSDLGHLLEIVAELGAAGVGLNPLHAQFYDRPDHSGSPYAPNSRLFLNPLYIDVEAGAAVDGSQTPEHAEFDCELVDYPAVAAAKVASLREIYRSFRAKS